MYVFPRTKALLFFTEILILLLCGKSKSNQITPSAF